MAATVARNAVEDFARTDTDVAPWSGQQQHSTFVFDATEQADADADDGAALADAAPRPRDRVYGAVGEAPAPADASTGESDADEPDSVGQPASDAQQERKRVRRLLKGTKVYFEAASPRDVVLVNAVESGCTVVHREEKADLIWIEATPRTANFVRGLTHERINFFPGMKVAASKCTFAALLLRVSRLYPGEFPFIPRTWALPADAAAFNEYVTEDAPAKMVYIVKPDGGCGGDGIYLTDDPKNMRHPQCVVQTYLRNPLTIRGLKFDFRLYVAVTSISPLRFYLHREGLARFAVQPYEAPAKGNFHKLNMHLTNYSLNKFSSDFVDNTSAEDDEHTTKRRASTAMRQLCEEYPDFDEGDTWDAIEELVGRTLGAVAPHVLATTGEIPGRTRYLSRCYQLLGFDVLLDADFKPHLLEINSHPSLQTDAPIDFAVKTKVVSPLVRMVALDARLQRKAAKAKRAFVPPTPEEAAAWEAQFTTEHGPTFAPCDPTTCEALAQRYMAPLLPMLRTFVEACGGCTGRTYDSMSSVRFARWCKKVGLAGMGRAFSTPEVDLLFIKCMQRKGYGNALEFYDFLDAMTGPVGDRISPHTPHGSLLRLRDVTQQLLSGGLQTTADS